MKIIQVSPRRPRTATRTGERIARRRKSVRIQEEGLGRDAKSIKIKKAVQKIYNPNNRRKYFSHIKNHRRSRRSYTQKHARYKKYFREVDFSLANRTKSSRERSTEKSRSRRIVKSNPLSSSSSSSSYFRCRVTSMQLARGKSVTRCRNRDLYIIDTTSAPVNVLTRPLNVLSICLIYIYVSYIIYAFCNFFFSSSFGVYVYILFILFTFVCFFFFFFLSKMQ